MAPSLKGSDNPYESGCNGWTCVGDGVADPLVSWHAHTRATVTVLPSETISADESRFSTPISLHMLRLDQEAQLGPYHPGGSGKIASLFIGLWVESIPSNRGSSAGDLKLDRLPASTVKALGSGATLAWNVTAVNLTPP